MKGSLERHGASRNEEITDISRRLKLMADELGITVLLLSQLSRAGDKRPDPRPKLSDLRESGALEQDADVVGFLHRKNHREGGLTYFIIEKERNGPTGTLKLDLDRDVSIFRDAPDAQEPEPPAPAPKKVKAPKAPGLL
jgi:replicative DNA helicase